MAKVLREYQENAITNIATKLANGLRKIVFQLATGGGKCLTLCAIANRYTQKSSKSVIIAVHRKELMKQTRNTLYNEFGIDCTIIAAGVRYIKPAKVYVCMVESLIRRIPRINTDIGMVIVDEAHINSFNKIHKYFPAENGSTTDDFAGTGEPYIIGFTATPMSATKKDPMRNHYQDIVCGVDIPYLISQGFLCQNVTYSPKDTVDRSTLAVRNGEFDESKMSAEFSKPKFVQKTIEAYESSHQGLKQLSLIAT